MEAVKAGVGRETAHHAIKEHAVGTVNDLRTGQAKENDLLERLANDDRVGLSAEKLALLLEQGRSNYGSATEQVNQFVAQVEALEQAYPSAADYTPGNIL